MSFAIIESRILSTAAGLSDILRLNHEIEIWHLSLNCLMQTRRKFGRVKLLEAQWRKFLSRRVCNKYIRYHQYNVTSQPGLVKVIKMPTQPIRVRVY